jgi:lipopolysaccharide-induced tumor necrosis factor-alpha factor
MALPPPSYESTMNPQGAPMPSPPGQVPMYANAPYPPPPGAGAYPPPPGTGAYPPPPPGAAPYGQQKNFPPPPPGYQHGQQGVPTVSGQAGQVIVVQQTAIHSFQPVLTHCPYCQQQVTTRVEYDNGMLTWLAAAGIAIMGCWLGCCLIPLCVDECKDAIHTCPACSKIIARKNRI